MIKQIAWNTFKKTGDINTYLELKQVANLEEDTNKTEKAEAYEINKNQRNNNCRT